jgi:hypothetical protein
VVVAVVPVTKPELLKRIKRCYDTFCILVCGMVAGMAFEKGEILTASVAALITIHITWVEHRYRNERK